MGAWGFVSLAYGIVWGAIVVYWLFLKRRFGQTEAELDRLRASELTPSDAKI